LSIFPNRVPARAIRFSARSALPSCRQDSVRTAPRQRRWAVTCNLFADDHAELHPDFERIDGGGKIAELRYSSLKLLCPPYLGFAGPDARVRCPSVPYRALMNAKNASEPPALICPGNVPPVCPTM
jgi:hypothetical protein